MKRFFYLLIVAIIMVASSNEQAVNEKIQCTVNTLLNGSITIANKDSIIYHFSFGANNQKNIEKNFFIILLSSQIKPEIIDLIMGKKSF